MKERHASATESGGTDGPDGRALRYLEWTPEVAAGDTTGVTHYSFLVREADGGVRCLHEAHVFGLFPRATWVLVFQEVGFEVDVVEEQTTDERVPRLPFLGKKIPTS